jgi:Terminase large subunit, T4likevirus-type, N-terminal
MITISLTNPQADFVEATEPYPCICAGFGAGKTQGAIYRALHKKLSYLKQSVAYYLPTYDLVKKIGYPRFEEAMDNMKIFAKINKSDHVIDVRNAGQIIFRTMDEPGRIVGYEVADSLVDELDTLKRDHAANVWRAIVSRNRQKKSDGSVNTIGVATTPAAWLSLDSRVDIQQRAQPASRLYPVAKGNLSSACAECLFEWVLRQSGIRWRLSGLQSCA